MSEDELESVIMSSTLPTVSFLNSLIAGGLAGTTVDVALFPIDTIKTRLQAPQGFAKAGGFRGIYNGLGAAAAGSAPGAALFFSTYERMKPNVLHFQKRVLGIENEAVSHMVAASMGEAVACMVRVPTEVVKAKMQTCSSCGSSVSQTVKMVLQEEGGILTNIFGGLYRGYGITLLREIPFAMIQFPLYEKLKVKWGESQGYKATPFQAAVCGSVSGGIAAAVTTPLDVIKTRLMLGKDRNGQAYKGGSDILTKIWKEEGAAKLFAGLQPRVMWISIGGFVFLGSYESYRGMLQPMLG
jgi:solute carrier family 25 S-adenosylmethionine transporter 26